jgi:iron uptake system EfeUOB component EfeO/EfeM
MLLHLPPLARRWLLALAVAMLAALGAFVAFTALGVGGEGTSEKQPAVTSLAQEDHISAKVRNYSQRVAIQEGDVAAGTAPNPEEQPISPAKFDAPVAAYRIYAQGQLRLLRGQLARLQGDLAAGNRDAAQQDWLAAYQRYLRLGAVYGLFPQLNRAIDGTAAALRQGVADPSFSGLHRIEYGLWSGQPTRQLLAPVQELERDVNRLGGVVATVQITPKEYARRAHEILEDAQRDFLSGDDVPYSHEGVAATAAALGATEAVLGTLRHLLGGQSSVGPVQFELARLRRVLGSLRARNGGRWPTLNQLSQYQNELLDGTLAASLQALSAIPDELAVHLPTPIPTIPKGKG